MKILLLGGCGYIGSSLRLFLENYHVDSVDLEWFSNETKNNVKEDYGTLKRSFLKNYDCVILLAGHSSVPMCSEMVPSFKNNVSNFIHLLSQLDDQKFIYASSSSIYGATKNLNAKETWLGFSPQTYYDLTKQEIDFYAKLSGKNYYGLRFGTVNGYSPNLRVDIMINKMVKVAKEAGRIEIFNESINRPILGLNDLCRAIKSIIDNTGEPGFYNLASFNSTVGDIANTVAAVLGNTTIIDNGTTKAYDFSICTNKFEVAYNFEFKETISSITKSLLDNWYHTTKTVRLEKPYT